MDLVQTIRKEGSRGGRDAFKWEDVKSSSHRENYLGHSVMAPVGRWQKNRDLSWYAKADGTEMSEAEARKEEMKLVKRAEDEAMAKALGIEVPVDNANLTALGDRPAPSAVAALSAPKRIEDGNGTRDERDHRERRRRWDNSREDRGERRHRRHHSRERRHRHRSRSESRSRSPPRHRRRRSHSQDDRREARPARDEYKSHRRHSDRNPRRSRSSDRRHRY